MGDLHFSFFESYCFCLDPEKKQKNMFHGCKGKQWILADIWIGINSIVGKQDCGGKCRWFGAFLSVFFIILGI